MFSKLTVYEVYRFPLVHVRRYGGATLLKKFEKLRALCCTSESAREKEEIEAKLRPTVREDCGKPCDDADEYRTPPELIELDGRTAMVVGGASGIGYEAADSMLKEGLSRVIIADTNQSEAHAAIKKLCSAYGEKKACSTMTDIRQLGSIERTFKEAYKRFNQVEVFVNCVGIYDETPQTWEDMVFTNLMGCVRGTLTAYKYMSQNVTDCMHSSVIVNMSSYGSIAAVPSMPLFSAVANGINGLTSSFGQDFHFSRAKVRFVTMCPSGTDSDMLKNMNKQHYDRSWAPHSANAIKYCTKQSPKVVGKAICNAVRFGNNGCIYVIKEGKYFRYAMPDYVKIMRHEACMW